MNLEHFSKYHVWAGDRIRNILLTLDEDDFTKDLGEEFSFNTLHKLALHSLGAAFFCISLIEQIEPDEFNKRYKEISEYTPNKLIQEWKSVDEKYAQLLSGDLSGDITVPPFMGKEFTISKLDFLLQYITHSTYHRGQITVALKKLNKETIGTDYLFYFDELFNK